EVVRERDAGGGLEVLAPLASTGGRIRLRAHKNPLPIAEFGLRIADFSDGETFDSADSFSPSLRRPFSPSASNSAIRIPQSAIPLTCILLLNRSLAHA